MHLLGMTTLSAKQIKNPRFTEAGVFNSLDSPSSVPDQAAK
jgi:hypothetical protein